MIVLYPVLKKLQITNGKYMNNEVESFIKLFFSRITDIHYYSALDYLSRNEPELALDITLQAICEEDVSITQEEFEFMQHLASDSNGRFIISLNMKKALENLTG